MSNEWWVTEIEWPKNGGQIASKFQCLGMSWGWCDNGLKERQRWVKGEAESGSCVGEREKKNLFYESLLRLTKNSGRAVKFFKGKIVFLLFGEVSKI